MNWARSVFAQGVAMRCSCLSLTYDARNETLWSDGGSPLRMSSSCVKLPMSPLFLAKNASVATSRTLMTRPYAPERVPRTPLNGTVSFFSTTRCCLGAKLTARASDCHPSSSSR